jgi:hypothetical protein
LTDMVTSVPPYETVSLIKNNILHQSKLKTTKITSKIQISEVCDFCALHFRLHINIKYVNPLANNSVTKIALF